MATSVNKVRPAVILMLGLLAGCSAKDGSGDNFAEPSLKLVGLAPLRSQSASAVERADLAAELRLLRLVSLATGEIKRFQLEPVREVLLESSHQAGELRGLGPPSRSVKAGWVWMELPWTAARRPATRNAVKADAGVEVSASDGDLGAAIDQAVLQAARRIAEAGSGNHLELSVVLERFVCVPVPAGVKLVGRIRISQVSK